MADSIVRLNVDSQEYDNKLKRAAEQLNRYADGCRKAGGTLEHVDEGVLEFTRSLGRMETTANTARGKLAEMTKAFTDLSVQYKNMTDEEKKGEFGKALNASLTELKGRIQESKTQLDDINKSINGGGGLTGALDNLAGKFGMSVQSLASWGTAFAAAKGALDVAKDAFFASEATVDEWGRVMDSSKSLYEGFLTALNTGDISGYLSRIDSIVQAARTAYNELDRLGTMKTIQAPQMSAQQTENERMRMMIQTGRYIAPIDGRKASMQNGQLLTPDQIKRIEQQLQNGMQKVVTLVGNEVAQTGRAIDAVYNRQAQELGMSLSEFRKGTSSMAEFDKRMAGYDQYQKWRAEHTTIDMQSGRETVARGNPFEQFAKWGTFRVDGDRYNDLVKLIQQRDQQAGQAYSMQSQAYRTMNRAEGVTLRQIMGGGSGGGGGRSGGGGGKTDATELQQNQQTINTLTQEYVRISNNANEETRKRQDEIQKEIQLLMRRNNLLKLYAEQAVGKLQGGDISASDLGSTNSLSGKDFLNIGAGLSEDVLPKATGLAKAGNDVAKSWQSAAAAVSNIGSAFSSIEDPATRVVGTIAQAVASIALGYATATAQAAEYGPWVWAGFAAGGLAQMLAMIASIHEATGYAQGGEIKGNSYSGDNIGGLVDGSQLVGLNAGEIVLTKAMQGSLARQLTSQGGGMQIVGVLKGENMYLMMNRYTKRSGKGEIVTWGG